MLEENKVHVNAEEAGGGLLSLIVALPVMSILMLSLGGLFVFGLRGYAMLLSDWELQDQVRIPMERLVMDLECAEKVEIKGKKLCIYTRKLAEAPAWIEYNLTNESQPRIMRNSQPLTGGSKLGDVVINNFIFSVESEGLVTFGIEAKNKLTNRQFALQTAVYIPGQLGE